MNWKSFVFADENKIEVILIKILKKMDAAIAIDREINKYLGKLNGKQKKAVLSVVKIFAEDISANNFGDQADYIYEMETRFKEMENGTVRVYTLKEAAERAQKNYSIKRKK